MLPDFLKFIGPFGGLWSCRSFLVVGTTNAFISRIESLPGTSSRESKWRECDERRTVDPGDRGDFRAGEPRAGVVRFSLVPAVHRLRGAQPVPVRVDAVVPDGKDPDQI